MKVWVLLLWLLLLHPLISDALDMCQEGDLRLKGRDGQNLIGGRIEICNGTHWRTVCHSKWDGMDAKVVCRQLGFPEGGEEYFHFGWEGKGGLTNFGCLGNETKLIDCMHQTTNIGYGCLIAGVACRTVVTETVTETVTHELTQTVILREQCTEVVPSQSPCTVTPPPITENAQRTGRNQQQQKDCRALAGGLGALAALMALGLVGVVVVWVWCRQRRVKSSTPNGIKASDATAKMPLDNPTYSSALSSQPHFTVQYSSLGPRGMPADHTVEGTAPTYDIIKIDGPPAELIGEGNYQVVRGEREKREGETYDVPFQRTTATPSTEDYSVLQHQ